MEKWLKEGDRNIAYFQRIPLGRSRIDHIASTKVGDQFVNREEDIRSAAKEFYF